MSAPVRYIYFVKPIGQNGPIKIGVTQDVVKRLQSMRADSPIELEMITHCLGGFKEEAQLHRQLLASHCRGSWFQPTDEVSTVVKRVVSGGHLASIVDWQTLNESPRCQMTRLAWADRRSANEAARAGVAA